MWKTIAVCATAAGAAAAAWYYQDEIKEAAKAAKKKAIEVKEAVVEKAVEAKVSLEERVEAASEEFCCKIEKETKEAMLSLEATIREPSIKGTLSSKLEDIMTSVDPTGSNEEIKGARAFAFAAVEIAEGALRGAQANEAFFKGNPYPEGTEAIYNRRRAEASLLKARKALAAL